MTDREDVAAAQRQVWEAANRRDLAALEARIDPDFLLVEADSLERKDKGDFLREVGERDLEPTLVEFALVNVQVQVLGEMAVAYAQFHGEVEIDGERMRLSGNAVDVFARRAQGWMLVGSVYGEVPPFTE